MVKNTNNVTPQPHHTPTKEEIKKYGYFYFALPPEDQQTYLKVLADPSMKEEIALLRNFAHSTLAKNPDDPATARFVTRMLKKIDRLERECEKSPSRNPVKPPHSAREAK